MPILFPSDEWAQALAAQLNASPAFIQAYQAKELKTYLIVEPEGALKEPAYIYLHLARGQVLEACMVRDRAEKKADLAISAPLGVWRKIYEGKLHPVVAAVKRQIKVEGNLVSMMRDARIMQSAIDGGAMELVFPE